MASSLKKLFKSIVGGEEQQKPASVPPMSSSDPSNDHLPASSEAGLQSSMTAKTGKLVAPRRQRALGGHKISRADPYDVPEGQSTSRPKRSKHAQFSPLEKQKKNTTELISGDQTADLNDSATTEVQHDALDHEQEPMPRRSPRKRARKSTEPAAPSSDKARKKSTEVAGPDIASNDSIQHEVDGTIVSKTDPADGIRSAKRVTDSGDHPPPQSASRKRGRPRKDRESGQSETTAQSGLEAQPSSSKVLGKRRSERVQNLKASAPRRSQKQEIDTFHLANLKRKLKKARRAPDGSLEQEDAEAEPEKAVPRHARISEVTFNKSDEVQDENAEDSADYAGKDELRPRRQRPQGPNSRKAKVGRSGRPNYSHLFVRWPQLELILQSTRQIGISHRGGSAQDKCEIPLSDRHVAGLVQRCSKLKTKLRSMVSAIEKEQEFPDVFDEFDAVKRGIDVLCGHTLDIHQPIDMKSADTASEIYFHIFPKLVDLLCCMLECFQMTDTGEAIPSLGISLVHGKMAANFIKWTLQLSHGASKYTTRPDSALSVVQPVREMVPKLRNMEKTMMKQTAREEELRERRARLARLAAQREAEEREEEQRRVQNVRWSEMQELWTQLHIERRYYEAAIIPKAKLKYLRLPGPELDVDFNGEEFERVQMFRPRVGPSPAAVQRIEDKGPWPETSVAALIEGLQKYADKGKKLIFRHIFAEYCGRGGPLNAYSVTEIVYWAAKLKESLLGNEDAEVEDWVLGIPNWLKAESLLDEV